MTSRRIRRVSRGVADVGLSVLAVLGLGCIVLVALAVFFNVSIVLFKTGSMSPTIPAGSAALVREIPVSEVNIGDVVTVDRPDALPVTHRVVEITRSANGVELELRGDANATVDPAPYRVDTVKLTMFAVPGVAPVIVALSPPPLLLAISVGAGVLVAWAFWPRGGERTGRRPRGAHRAHRAPVNGAGGVVALVIAFTGFAVSSSEPASADVREQVIQGSVLRLTTVGDPEQMGALEPGAPVNWTVGVQADAPSPGTVNMDFGVSGEASEWFEISVAACSIRWSGERCEGATSMLVPAFTPEADAWYHLGEMTEHDQRWIRLRVGLAADAPFTRTELRSAVTVRATGFGDEVSASSGGESMARTGSDAAPGFLLAACLLAGGLVAAGVAQRRRARARGEAP